MIPSYAKGQQGGKSRWCKGFYEFSGEFVKLAWYLRKAKMQRFRRYHQEIETVAKRGSELC